MAGMLRAVLGFSSAFFSQGYDNNAPRSRMPPLGWSSWNALGPFWGTNHGEMPQHGYCDEVSIKTTIDALIDPGLYATP
jgi:hypothetical protein